MKVKELQRLLKDEDPEAVVILAKDEEGNGYSPLDEVFSNGFYQATTGWGGEYYDLEDLPEQFKDAVSPCIVLWPMN